MRRKSLVPAVQLMWFHTNRRLNIFVTRKLPKKTTTKPSKKDFEALGYEEKKSNPIQCYFCCVHSSLSLFINCNAVMNSL